MVRIYYRSIFDELNDMRAYRDMLTRKMADPKAGVALLPAAGEPAKMLPVFRGDLKVNVTEDGDGVVVRADMIPGVSKKDITIDLINPKLRGWVNYFRIGNSSACFTYIKDWVEKKVRRHLMRARNRQGFGWNRWSRGWLYKNLGLYNDYGVRHYRPESAASR